MRFLKNWTFKQELWISHAYTTGVELSVQPHGVVLSFWQKQPAPTEPHGKCTHFQVEV